MIFKMVITMLIWNLKTCKRKPERKCLTAKQILKWSTWENMIQIAIVILKSVNIPLILWGLPTNELSNAVCITFKKCYNVFPHGGIYDKNFAI